MLTTENVITAGWTLAVACNRFCRPSVPTGVNHHQYLLVVVDKYSRFPLLGTLSSLNATDVTAKLSDTFAVHEMPYNLKTENSSSFFGKEFAAFLQCNGIRHHRTTPLWPQEKMAKSRGS